MVSPTRDLLSQRRGVRREGVVTEKILKVDATAENGRDEGDPEVDANAENGPGEDDHEVLV